MKRLYQILCVGLLAALVFLPLLQVIMRDLLGAALIGSGELTRFLLICLVFVSYPLVIDNRENVVMSELRSLITGKAGIALTFLISISATIACAFLSYTAYISIMGNLTNSTPTLKIPSWIFFGATFLGAGLGALVHLRQGLHGSASPAIKGE
ncbi:TRAP transporter small permease subunit [uncultured Cohaesibacter sp.]|uniref:TRAP transporter small permease n=1 Tax=uncultured Cohaesibacter sp. TaxID=1002546 RepID=UPI002AAC3A6C|nr:TRAP transporter small permease subunit [uncultured Cohaesibacter sp.]